MRDGLMGSERRRQAAEMAKESRRALNAGGARRARRATFTEAPDTKGHSNVHGPGEADTEESTARHTGKITVFQTGAFGQSGKHTKPLTTEKQNSGGPRTPQSRGPCSHAVAPQWHTLKQTRDAPTSLRGSLPVSPSHRRHSRTSFQRLRTARMPFAVRARLTRMRAVRKRDSLYPARATARWKTCLGPDPATRHMGQTANAART